MVAGVVLTAVGDQIVITHPAGHTRPATRVSRNRWIGLLVLAALTPVTLRSPPAIVALAVTAVLTGIAASDAARSRGRPPEAPSPPGGPA